MTGATRLQFQGEKAPSIAPKVSLISWYLLCTAAGAWLTLSATHEGSDPGNPARQALLLACVLIYIARAATTLFAFLKRKIPWWEAAWGGIPIGLVLFFALRDGLRTPQPLGVADAAGILLYLAGSYLGTASEYSRNIWKSRPENQGRLYTGGLFKYSRHINYFGDLLLFLGFGILTTLAWTVIVPLAMALNFVFFIIPAHDAYISTRYGTEFEDYARRTRKLIPFVY
jgi:protein-S-isoprenylcysteine O-methyltransferase Ste14